MKRTLIIVSMVTATLAVSMAATAYGQSSRASELKRRIVEQARTAAPKPAAAPVQTEAGDEPSSSARYYAPKNALAGTWDLILTFSDGSEVPSTLQIMAGPADGEGSAIHASIFSLAPPNPTLPEQGSWRYVRRNQFITSYYGYSFDEQLQPFGKIGFRHAITLSHDQDHFTGEAVFEVIDLDGNVLFSDNVETAGVRQRAATP